LKAIDLQRKDAILNQKFAQLQVEITKTSSLILTTPSSKVGKLVAKRIRLETEKAAVSQTIEVVRRALRAKAEDRQKAEQQAQRVAIETLIAEYKSSGAACPRCGKVATFANVSAPGNFLTSKTTWSISFGCDVYEGCGLRFQKWFSGAESVESPNPPQKKTPPTMRITMPKDVTHGYFGTSESEASTQPTPAKPSPRSKVTDQ